jgi:dTDP-glucose 4,6-dehydratase
MIPDKLLHTEARDSSERVHRTEVHFHNVLVTGGAGFIGSNFVRFLLNTEKDLHIYNLDALTYAGNLDNLVDLPDPARHTFIRGNICDRELVNEMIRANGIDTIVHFAAETHVDRSILDPEKFIQTNIIGTFNLLEAARQNWLSGGSTPPGSSGRTDSHSSPGGSTPPNAPSEVPFRTFRFHHVSTDEVFGTLSPTEPAWKENTPYAPNSPYSASKASSDHLVRAYHHTFGMPITITNCSNNYGPFMYPEKLIPLMITNAMEGKPLPVYGDGQQIRDWLYVEDHCEAIWAVLNRGKVGETYNIGGGNQPTNLKVIQTLCDILDECAPRSPYVPHAQLIKFIGDRPGHDRRYAMDISKINQELGWLPRYSLESGLLNTVQWYLSHPDWVASIRQRNDYQEWLQRNYIQRAG